MLTFSDVHRHEPDEWSSKGEIFTKTERLAELKRLVEGNRFLIAEHWHYRGSRCPDRLIIEDYDDFIDYLESNAIAGDIIDIFDLLTFSPVLSLT